MNRTPEFLDAIRQQSRRSKALGSQTHEKLQETIESSVLRPNKRPSPQTPFAKESVAISEQLDKLELSIDDIRVPYLTRSKALLAPGSTGLTEQDKDKLEQQFHQWIKTSLQRIQVLKQMADTEKNRARQSASSKFFAASASCQYQLFEHMNAIVWILENKLMSLSKELKTLQERRMEFTASRPLTPSQATPVYKDLKPGKLGAQVPEESDDWLEELPPDQIQLLESENDQLLQQLQGAMDEVTKATQSLQEIANLQSTMAFHLTAQQEVIQSIHQDAMDSVANMSLANQQLKKTDKIFGQARLWIFVFLVGASFVLLFLDYYG